jgi:hypothetical protein
MSVDNVEVAEATENTPLSAFTEAAEEVSTPNAKYTNEDLAKARSQEKEKLYPVVDKLKEELAILSRSVRKPVPRKQNEQQSVHNVKLSVQLKPRQRQKKS